MPKHQLCRNCGRVIDSNYCPYCGQRSSTHRLTGASLIESITSTFIGDEAYGLQGIHMRKGIVTTWLSILWQPHVVIGEFIGGHRRKYFNPVAILLLLSTLYAVVFMLVGNEYVPIARDGQNWAVHITLSFIDYAKVHPAAYLLLSLPPFALAMKTVFHRRSDLRYIEYLYIGIFLAIFEISWMILMLPTELLLPKSNDIYTKELPTFIYATYVFYRLFGLGSFWAALKKSLLIQILQYIYLVLIVTASSVAIICSCYALAPAMLRESIKSMQEIRIESGDSTLKEFFDGVSDSTQE